MKSIYIPWGAWYQEKKLELSYPENWDVSVCDIGSKRGIDRDGIKDAIYKPVGVDRISTIAKGKETVAIAIEDITRPSYLGDIVSIIIEELHISGIRDENIKFIICNGAHKPLQRADLIKKLGQTIVDNYIVYNHNPYENLVDTGTTMGNLPVMINKFFMDAEFRIVVGSITPHAFAGFSGGAKLVIPGLAGIDILARSHKFVLMGLRGGSGNVDNNKFRTEIEDIVQKIKTDFFVGCIPGAERKVVSVVAGDVVKAHREGVKYAEKYFATDITDEIDIVILNAYPKDTELLQVDKVFSILKSYMKKINENATIIITSACSEGFGCHSLFSPGMRLYKPPSRKRFISERNLLFFSPNINKYEFYNIFWEGYSLYNRWDDLVSNLSKNHTNPCKVAVFTVAPLQLAWE